MRFERFALKPVSFEAFLVWPFLNVLLIFLLALGLRPFLFPEAGLVVQLPRSVSRAAVSDARSVIIIDRDDHIYYQARRVSVQELEKAMGADTVRPAQVLIKSDSRARLETLSSVWEACRRSGVQRITMATTG